MFEKEWSNLNNEINKIDTTLIKNSSSINILSELLIVAEDHRFKSHYGIDIIALFRAVWRTFFCNKREGASTIAMQLVRTLRGNYDLSINRKVSEIALAIKLTKTINREEIILLYLSKAYFGWNMYGIKDACVKLGMNIDTLSLNEAASLIARLKYPEPRNNLINRKEKIKIRSCYIVNRYTKIKGYFGSI
ncbi:biosynthetic peptidoglycan transglycosylase [Aliarcobacter skirrowii]|uniref:Glycosyl transferase family 51 domain-containing protein n=1 Tax=Aliarcobacter cryaerophilus TaxID=28198 RepID=A0A5C0E3Z2_9BACT|nr:MULTISPECIES: biosynthetic peptidoglycan transglycosylase [Aliarcobacter]MDX4049135.1 biosynthetic peptidoglycan transglycosylase [Aliarcobacter skirrowii]QEI46287.1 hypothetical protein pM830MA_0108 [Aliarcobacter cryaerophilus]